LGGFRWLYWPRYVPNTSDPFPNGSSRATPTKTSPRSVGMKPPPWRARKTVPRIVATKPRHAGALPLRNPRPRRRRNDRRPLVRDHAVAGARSAHPYDLHFDEVTATSNARAVLRLLEARCRELGVGSIGLQIFAHDTMAQVLYSSLGFIVTTFNMSKRFDGS